MSDEMEQPRHSERPWLLGCAMPVGLTLLLGGLLLWPAVRAARESAHRASCIGNLKFVGGDVQNYVAAYGRYPPAYIADAQGRPMHSWRLLLQRKFGQGAFDQYDPTQPWNSPQNIALAPNVPLGMAIHIGAGSQYHCPSEGDTDVLDTSVVMIVGPGTISDGPTSRTEDELTDGTSRTILAAEMSHSGIHWMEPRDLDFASMGFKINAPGGPCIRSAHPGTANAAFADGSVRSLSNGMDPRVLKALITINGGERITGLDDNWQWSDVEGPTEP